MIAALLERERVNVKDLSLSVPDLYSEYRPGITYTDYQAMVRELNSLRSIIDEKKHKKEKTAFDDQVRQFGMLASDLKLLFPQVDLVSCDEEIRTGLLNQLEEDSVFRHALYELTALKILYPDTFLETSFDNNLWSEYKKDYRNEFERKNQSGNIIGLIWDLSDIKLTFPHLLSEIAEPPWEMVKKGFDYTRDMARSRGASWDFDCLINEAGSIKILYPERFEELGIDSEDWRGFRRALEIYRKSGKWNNSFSNYAKLAAIIASDEVIITKEKIEIKLPPHQILNLTHDLPAVRRF